MAILDAITSNLDKFGGVAGAAGSALGAAGQVAGGGILSSTLSLAGTGASIGAIGGPIGMAIGAGVGAIAGAIKGKVQENKQKEIIARQEFNTSKSTKPIPSTDAYANQYGKSSTYLNEKFGIDDNAGILQTLQTI